MLGWVVAATAPGEKERMSEIHVTKEEGKGIYLWFGYVTQKWVMLLNSDKQDARHSNQTLNIRDSLEFYAQFEKHFR